MTPCPLREAVEVELFGGKAVQLGRAIREGLRVPAGFALPAPFVAAFEADGGSVRSELSRITTSLRAPFAVRSSGIGEDSSGASFAGQHATVLNVRGEEQLCTAIARVAASGRTAAAQAYRRKLGLEGTARMGIVVQELVDPIAAGVLFTRDPVSGCDDFVIEGSWGLGETVVAGEVVPDRFRLDRTGTILERVLGEKDVRLATLAAGGTEARAVDAAEAAVACVSDAQLLLLFRLALDCERVFGPDLDLEWAIDDSGPFLLQVRAITRAGGR